MSNLSVENISLNFPIYDSDKSFRKTLLKRTVGGILATGGKNNDKVFVRALNNVSISLRTGDRLGLIGHNGAGKSTLLKVMAGIYKPDAGNVYTNNKVSSIFGHLVGMDDADNAYRNIEICCKFLGMSSKDINNALPSIEEFCELGDYMHMPIRTYSAGMLARLSFAITTAIHPDILLMDEGIGAGDARFANKAKKRIEEFLGRANIIVLASHSHELIRTMCNKAALMEKGEIICHGTVDYVYAEYEKYCTL